MSTDNVTRLPPTTAGRVRERARAVARKRARIAEIETEALDELAELMDAARGCGVSITELAKLAGYKTRKPLYDYVNRRDGG